MDDTGVVREVFHYKSRRGRRTGSKAQEKERKVNADLIAVVSLCGIAVFCIAVSWLAERLIARAERKVDAEFDEEVVGAGWTFGTEEE